MSLEEALDRLEWYFKACEIEKKPCPEEIKERLKAEVRKIYA